MTDKELTELHWWLQNNFGPHVNDKALELLAEVERLQAEVKRLTPVKRSLEEIQRDLREQEFDEDYS